MSVMNVELSLLTKNMFIEKDVFPLSIFIPTGHPILHDNENK